MTRLPKIKLAPTILLFLIFALCTAPVTIKERPFPPISTTLFVTIASIAAVFVVGGRWWAAVVAVPSIIAIAILIISGRDVTLHDHVLPGFLVAFSNIVTAIAIARSALSRSTHGDSRIFLGASSYLLIGIAFTMVHQRIAILDQNAYRVPGATPEFPIGRWIDYLWFSFSTLTTSGFADVTARSSWARLACTLEAMTGVMFPAIFLARMVSAASAEDMTEKP
ncbi:MAG: two pore domain potassium channel family protein [Phycisphaerales bacterium]|nr:two pore domain potassium channel family protein [Phycisphaerales bacterium]